jgi:mannose-6-phosphate isomerase
VASALAAPHGGVATLQVQPRACPARGASGGAGRCQPRALACFPALRNGTVAEQVHEIPVSAGDFVFIPSGRLHAIGAGLLIFEIQQNSDTTYRVFDWNRLGLDGKARQLHIEESLASIDYSDIEPRLDQAQGHVIAACEYFVVERFAMALGEMIGCARADRFSLLHIVEGELTDREGKSWGAGSTVLLTVGEVGVRAVKESIVLRTHIP